MERSAINSYTMAGAFLGLLFGLWAANELIGTDSPESFFSLATFIAMPITALSWWLVARRYRKAGLGERRFYAISGWFALLVCAGLMVAGVARIFP